MGGRGSNPWGPHHQRKPRVEECWVLEIKRLLRALTPRETGEGGGSEPDGWAWKNRQTGEITFAVKVSPASTADGGPALRLEAVDLEQPKLIDQVVPLEQLEVLGGRTKRWFGRCPQCLERCSKLYLSPGNDRFGCRRCLDLSYES